MSNPPAAPARLAAIDMLKGVAILWVILIHAGPLGEALLRLAGALSRSGVPLPDLSR